MSTPLLSVPVGAMTQAERWFARLGADDCTTTERETFMRWRDARPEHAAAWVEVEHTFALSRQLLDDPALAGVLADARRIDPHAWTRPIWRAAVASMLVATVVLGSWWLTLPPSAPAMHYATRVGEQRHLALADGSRVLLDTQSAITVAYEGKQRRVSLTQGRAEFQVVHDAARPFIVTAAGGSVRALGTRFQVQAQGMVGTVVLLEGAVAVNATARKGREHATTLRPGEALSFDVQAGLWQKQKPDLAFARGWTQGDLVFNEQRLDALLKESNRYAVTPLRLGEPTLGSIRVSGVFRAGNQASLVRALEHGWRLQAKTTPDGAVVLSRRDP